MMELPVSRIQLNTKVISGIAVGAGGRAIVVVPAVALSAIEDGEF